MLMAVEIDVAINFSLFFPLIFIVLFYLFSRLCSVLFIFLHFQRFGGAPSCIQSNFLYFFLTKSVNSITVFISIRKLGDFHFQCQVSALELKFQFTLNINMAAVAITEHFL